MGAAAGTRPRFGRYELVRELAQGGMGRIYLARQSGIEGFSRLCVLKRIRADLADNDLAALLIDEARIAANLNHPNVATIYDFGRQDGELFLTMEYVAGPNLDDICRRAHQRHQPLSRELGIHLVAEIARGLAYAHEARDSHGRELAIVHRDISPQNVLVSIHGEVKITDFGIARAAGKLHRSITGEVRGKIQYMSPEQLAGARVDRRADIYALGAMLWELTVGRQLFPGRTVDEVVASRMAGPPPDPRSIDPGYPPELADAVMSALADLDQRTPSARILADQLAACAAPYPRDQLGGLVRELFPDAGDIDLAGETPVFSSGADSALATGMKVGDFEVVGVLGEGGHGVVYDAINPMIGKRAAIKVLRASFAADQQAVSRFLDEARAVNEIDHPNIVDIFAFGELPDGRPYCAMDRLDGETLGQLLRQGPLAIERGLEILDEVAAALDAAHRRNIFHRDLKPDNVFIATTGDVKVLDFGLAKLESRSLAATQTGAPVGTPMYMSPEQASGAAVDGRTDVYSFGVLAYRALGGRHPFAGDRPVDALVARFASDPIPPSAAGLPSELDEPLLRCLARDPAARFASVGEAVAALRDAHARSGRRSRSRIGMVIAAAVIAIGSVAATAIAMSAGGGDESAAKAPVDAAVVAPESEPAPAETAPELAVTADAAASANDIVEHRDELKRALIDRMTEEIANDCINRGVPKMPERVTVFFRFPTVGRVEPTIVGPRSIRDICEVKPYREKLVEKRDLRWKPTYPIRFRAPPARTTPEPAPQLEPRVRLRLEPSLHQAITVNIGNVCSLKIKGQPQGPARLTFETDERKRTIKASLSPRGSGKFVRCILGQLSGYARHALEPNTRYVWNLQLFKVRPPGQQRRGR